jgi:hypothetical protein
MPASTTSPAACAPPASRSARRLPSPSSVRSLVRKQSHHRPTRLPAPGQPDGDCVSSCSCPRSRFAQSATVRRRACPPGASAARRAARPRWKAADPFSYHQRRPCGPGRGDVPHAACQARPTVRLLADASMGGDITVMRYTAGANARYDGGQPPPPSTHHRRHTRHSPGMDARLWLLEHEYTGTKELSTSPDVSPRRRCCNGNHDS